MNLINLSEEDYASIENFGYMGFGIEEIALNFEVDKKELIRQFEAKQGEVYGRWFKGWLKSEIELRQVIMESALNGSQPAILQMKKIKNTTEKSIEIEIYNHA
jgi:hypothetical protein